MYEVAKGREIELLLANAGRGLGNDFLDQDFDEARAALRPDRELPARSTSVGRVRQPLRSPRQCRRSTRELKPDCEVPIYGSPHYHVGAQANTRLIALACGQARPTRLSRRCAPDPIRASGN
jgi:hypothetical protein